MILDNIGKILTLLMIVVIAYLFLFKKASLQKYWRDKQTEIEEKQQKKLQTADNTDSMKKKTWEVQHENITIRVENSWTWGGIVKEKILINDEVVYEYFGKMQSIGLCKHFCVDGHNITVKLGSKWHMLGTACQIWIDDRVVCGDQWVLFANKTS